MVLVRKKDGSVWFCVDYRKLNFITVRYSYPIPRLDKCIDSVGDATVFTTLQFNSGYCKIPVAEEDKDKTTFVFRSGLLRFLSLRLHLCQIYRTELGSTRIILLLESTMCQCLMYCFYMHMWARCDKLQLSKGVHSTWMDNYG